jgi:hypothetical protein
LRGESGFPRSGQESPGGCLGSGVRWRNGEGDLREVAVLGVEGLEDRRLGWSPVRVVLPGSGVRDEL